MLRCTAGEPQMNWCPGEPMLHVPVLRSMVSQVSSEPDLLLQPHEELRSPKATSRSLLQVLPLVPPRTRIPGCWAPELSGTAVRPSVRPSARLSVCPSVRQTVCPSVRLSVCPSVRPSVRPSVCLSACCCCLRYELLMCVCSSVFACEVGVQV